MFTIRANAAIVKIKNLPHRFIGFDKTLKNCFVFKETIAKKSKIFSIKSIFKLKDLKKPMNLCGKKTYAFTVVKLF